MRIEEPVLLDYNDVLIKPKRSTLRSRNDVDLNRTYIFKYSQKKWTGVPIVAANMDTVGNFSMAKALSQYNLMVAIHKHYQLNDWVNNYVGLSDHEQTNVWFSIGTTERDQKNLNDLLNSTRTDRYSVVDWGDGNHYPIDKICLDVANGYSEHFVEVIQRIRENFPDIIIMAGNVVTSDMTEQLILAGADVVKVGIGPGSHCTTRKMTGVGYPQLSAVAECADAAHGLGGLVCADGGCSTPGDISKAFGAGADFVMIGGMVNGTDQADGEEIRNEHGELTHKISYGMSSTVAQQKHGSGIKEYRASEGRVVKVPYRGDVTKIIQEILGGLRSTCTYVGAKTLKELPKRTTFIKVNSQLNKVYENNTIGS